MNRIKQILVAVCISLALAFTFSCSSDDGGGTTDTNQGDDGKAGGSGACPNAVTVNATDVVPGKVTCGGKTYKTVKIGTQTWMAENLNYNVTGSKCYENDNSNCTTYGSLYDWATAMGLESSCNSTSGCTVQSKHKGICPTDWHIPSDAEWTTLTDYVQSASQGNCSDCAGTRLKATSGWNDNGNGTDNYGFSALPGGSDNSDGSFDGVGDGGLWWSSSEDDSYSYFTAYYRHMSYIIEGVFRSFYDRPSLFSVRCVQN